MGASRGESDRSESSACLRTVWRRVMSEGVVDSPWIWASKASRGSMMQCSELTRFETRSHSFLVVVVVVVPTQCKHGTVTRERSVFLFVSLCMVWRGRVECGLLQPFDFRENSLIHSLYIFNKVDFYFYLFKIIFILIYLKLF